MNVQSIFVFLMIVGAIWAAVSIFKQHGLSWTSLLAPGVIWLMAFLILWIGNTWAIKPMRNQAEGLANQGQSLLNEALPAVIEQPANVDTYSGNNQSFGNTDNNSYNPNQTTVIVPTAVVPVVPNVGDTRYAGEARPSYGNEFILTQMLCFNSTATLTDMAMQNHLPTGVTMSIVPITTFWQSPDKEVWEIRVTVPHAQAGNAVWTTDGVTARAMKEALGTDNVVGSSSWPLVMQSWDGVNWNTITPVTCQFQ